jgi:hypothetical protein
MSVYFKLLAFIKVSIVDTSTLIRNLAVKSVPFINTGMDGRDYML